MTDERAPGTRIIHICSDFEVEDPLVPMYCSAAYADVSDLVDWYAWQLSPGPDFPSQCLEAVSYCPWCGLKLPDTPAEALVNPTFYQEPVSDDEDDNFEEEENVHV